MRILGIDYGRKRVGIALGDTESMLAFPVEVVQNHQNLAKDLAKMVKEEFVDTVVIGMPFSQEGMPSTEQVLYTETFIEALKKETTTSIITVDERNTSLEAKRLIKEEGAKAEIDALAAMLIVQDYLAEQQG